MLLSGSRRLHQRFVGCMRTQFIRGTLKCHNACCTDCSPALVLSQMPHPPCLTSTHTPLLAPMVRSLKACSLMKPAASFWS